MLVRLLLAYICSTRIVSASRIEITNEEWLSNSISSGGRQHTLAIDNQRNVVLADGHQASYVHSGSGAASNGASETQGTKRQVAKILKLENSPRSTATVTIIAIAVGGLCGFVAYKCMQPKPARQVLSVNKDGRSSKRSYNGQARPGSVHSVSKDSPSSSADLYKDKDRAAGNADSSSSDEDTDGRPGAPAKPAVDQTKVRVQEIEQAAKCLSVTCKKMPLHPTGFLGGAGGAKERHISAKPAAYEKGSSWPTILKAWKRGVLGYWVDEKACKAGQEAKGTIALSDIIKVTIPDKHMEQVIVKYKDNLQDGHLTLQFKDHSSATAWRDSFKELRGKI